MFAGHLEYVKSYLIEHNICQNEQIKEQLSHSMDRVVTKADHPVCW